MRNALRELDSVIERVRKRAQQPRDARLSLMPLLPVRSNSCRDGAAAQRRCRARIGRRRVGCAGG